MIPIQQYNEAFIADNSFTLLSVNLLTTDKQFRLPLTNNLRIFKTKSILFLITCNYLQPFLLWRH